jgi:hypothetical protein
MVTRLRTITSTAAALALIAIFGGASYAQSSVCDEATVKRLVESDYAVVQSAAMAGTLRSGTHVKALFLSTKILFVLDRCVGSLPNSYKAIRDGIVAAAGTSDEIEKKLLSNRSLVVDGSIMLRRTNSNPFVGGTTLRATNPLSQLERVENRGTVSGVLLSSDDVNLFATRMRMATTDAEKLRALEDFGRSSEKVVLEKPITKR